MWLSSAAIFIPMALLYLRNISSVSALVKMSAVLSSVSTLTYCNSPRDIRLGYSRAKWCMMSMCFDFSEMEWFLSLSKQAWLSPWMTMTGNPQPISLYTFLTHIPSLPALDAAWYSASIVDSDTVACLLACHEHTDPDIIKQYPVTDLLSVLSVAKSESQNAVRVWDAEMVQHSPNVRVPARYLSTWRASL